MSIPNFAANRSLSSEARQRQIEDTLQELCAAVSHTFESLGQTGDAADTTGGGSAAVAAAAGGGGGGGSGAVSLLGDVTGPAGANTVEKVRNTTFPAPVAGDDEKFVRFQNATPAFEYAHIPLAGDVTGDNTATVIVGLPRALFDHFADAGNTAGETDLYSDTLTAGRLAANGQKIVAQYGGIFAGSATATQELRAYFGGTAIFDSGALSLGAVTDNWDLSVTVIRESSSVVRCSVTFVSNFATLPATATYTRVTGLTLANTQVLKITGESAGVGAGADQIVAKEGYVEWRPAA